jgi:hypothetical protein
VSIRLAEKLGGVNVNPRTGRGKPTGSFLYVLFPRSRSTPPWPVTMDAIQDHADAALAAIGGWERVLACVNT